MKALRLYLTSFNRYRRSRGFGVHSPFAYHFIKRVIKEQCGYYAYSDIDAAVKKSGMSRKTARLLFRVANYFNPSSILIVGNGDIAALTALKSVSTTAKVTVAGADETIDASGYRFVYVESEAAYPGLEKTLGKTVDNGGTVVIDGMTRDNEARRLLKAVENGMTHGMTFSNGATAIIAGDRKLPRQRFALWF